MKVRKWGQEMGSGMSIELFIFRPLVPLLRGGVETHT